jgi:hypothetical protein
MKEASNTFDIQVFEKLMKDKDLVIQDLNGQIVVTEFNIILGMVSSVPNESSKSD